MNFDEYLKNNKKAIIVHKPSVYYGFVIGAIIATSIMFANRPMTYAENLGCKGDETITVENIKGHVITGCKKRKKK